jgi:drug/metabolite transporter (DMT)-like permease
MNLTVFLLVLAAACCHALWNFFSKKASGDFTILWYGLALVNIPLLVFALWDIFTAGIDPRGLVPAGISALAHCGYFFTLSYNYARGGGISTVYPLSRGAGVLGTVLLAYFIFSEPIRPAAAFGITAICSGIFAIAFAKNGNEGRRLQPCLIALATGLCIVAYSLADNQGVRFIKPLVYNTILNCAAILPLVRLAHPGGRAAAWKLVRAHIRETLIIGVGCTGTYLLILSALRFERASYVIPLREFSVVIASLLGFIFLREKPAPLKIAGIILITAGILLIKAG